MHRLLLDHLTLVDATPSELADTAARVECAGICLFLHPMDVLPAMPDFELIGDTPERRATRAALRQGGLTLDLVYPFTVSGRTEVAAFEPALESAAWLGARLANVLCYDREPGRRLDKLSALAELAEGYDIQLAIEFYPLSQIRSFAEARAAIDAVGRSDIGLTVDLLHLTRSGELPAALSLLADRTVRIAQICDGPRTMAADRREWEANSERLLPGEGAFDVASFVRALSPGCPISVEVPRASALGSGQSLLERAHCAVDAAKRTLELSFAHG